MPSDELAVITDSDVFSLLAPLEVVALLEASLRAGLDPADDPDRGVFETRYGQMLLMPTEVGARAGIKVATVAPANAGTGFPRIQGLFLLFDAESLRPLSVIDGVALTALRTPAVSIAAVRARLVRGDEPLRVVVYGTGPQGIGHAASIADLVAGGRGVESIVYLVRRARPPLPGMPLPHLTRVVLADSAEAEVALRRAQVVVCATTSSEALFDSALLQATAVVIAVGSHEPTKRELDGELLARSNVVVEDIPTALREAGDIIRAVDDGDLSVDDLIPLTRALASPESLDSERPLVFKSTGMAWEDVVVAARIDELWRQRVHA
jgi:ornithine cyclodeaminase